MCGLVGYFDMKYFREKGKCLTTLYELWHEHEETWNKIIKGVLSDKRHYRHVGYAVSPSNSSSWAQLERVVTGSPSLHTLLAEKCPTFQLIKR